MPCLFITTKLDWFLPWACFLLLVIPTEINLYLKLSLLNSTVAYYLCYHWQYVATIALSLQMYTCWPIFLNKYDHCPLSTGVTTGSILQQWLSILEIITTTDRYPISGMKGVCVLTVALPVAVSCLSANFENRLYYR